MKCEPVERASLFRFCFPVCCLRNICPSTSPTFCPSHAYESMAGFLHVWPSFSLSCGCNHLHPDWLTTWLLIARLRCLSFFCLPVPWSYGSVLSAAPRPFDQELLPHPCLRLCIVGTLFMVLEVTPQVNTPALEGTFIASLVAAFLLTGIARLVTFGVRLELVALIASVRSIAMDHTTLGSGISGTAGRRWFLRAGRLLLLIVVAVVLGTRFAFLAVSICSMNPTTSAIDFSRGSKPCRSISRVQLRGVAHRMMSSNSSSLND